MLIQTRNKRRVQPQLLTNSLHLDGQGRDQRRQSPANNRKTENKAEKTKAPQLIDKVQKPPKATEATFAKEPKSEPVAKASNNNSKLPKRRHVRFHSVELQEYAVTVGDHPLCKGYFPLTLDWSHARPVEFRINEYERRRIRNRSELQELHMNARERWERLRLVTGLTESTLAIMEQSRHRE